MIEVIKFYKNCAARIEVSISQSFHQNDRNVSDHLILVTDDIEIVGQDKNLQKYLFMPREDF